MIKLNNPYLYAKGTCNVVVRDISTGNVDYQSTKVQTNQFATTCNMGEIRAGLGNAIAIQIPSDCAVNLTLTNADFSMQSRAFQVGSTVAHNSISPVCESITATDTTLTVTGTPVAPLGYTTSLCNVNYVGSTSAGVAYPIDADTKVVTGFTATPGTTYTVFYFEENASAEQVTIYSQFTPATKHVTAQVAIYSTENTSNQNQGTLAGYLYIIIPRMQFSGKADTDGSQSNAATSELSGTALSYESAAAAGVCTDCAMPELAYMVYVPNAGATSAVEGLAIVGGDIAVVAGSTAQTPIKYVINGVLVQPNYGDLTYSIPSGDSAIATVSATGVITGVGAGDTEITVSLASPALSTVANVTVSAP